MKQLTPEWAFSKFCILWFVVLAFTAARAGAADEPTLVLTETDDTKTVNLGDNKAVLVKLIGNPTTGYSWVLGKIEGPALQLVGGVDYERGGGPGVGEGGNFLARFSVAGSGEAKIQMEYRRAWEKDKPPAKTFTVTVMVKGPETKPESKSATTLTPMPSTVPTTKPSSAPTTAPTTSASTVPTTKPSTTPTTGPAAAPATAPASAPATHPTRGPTTRPTTNSG